MTKEEKKKEADFLYEVIKTSLTFLSRLYKPLSNEETWRSLEVAKDKCKLSDLQMVINDIVEMSEAISFEDQSKLNATLLEELGVDIKMMKFRNKQKLEKVLKRGYLKSDNEARMVEYWVNEYCQAGVPDDEIDPLNALLSDYDRRVEAKWAAKKAAKEAKKASKQIKITAKEVKSSEE